MSGVRDRLHELADEIADMLEGAAPADTKPVKRAALRRRPLARVPPPLGKPSDIDRAAARETLRRRGIYT